MLYISSQVNDHLVLTLHHIGHDFRLKSINHQALPRRAGGFSYTGSQWSQFAESESRNSLRLLLI